MAERAAEIAQLLLREGALRHADPEHRQVRQALLGHAELFEEVRHRLAAVGFTLVERLGHIGVAVDPDAAHLAGGVNRMGLHAGHLRLIVYLWTHLVYREWSDLRRDRRSAAPGAEQGALLGLAPEADGEEEPPSISLSHVQAELSEAMSKSYFKGLLRALQRWRFIRYDEKRDRLWADAALYTLVDLAGMEDFVVDLARRLGSDDPVAAVTAVAAGSIPTRTSPPGSTPDGGQR